MAEGFVVERHQSGPVSVLRFKGGCDRAGLRALREMLEECLAGVDSGLVIDLAEVSFVDSSGVAFLLKTRRALANDKRPMLLTAVPALVRRTFVTLGVDNLFEFGDDEAAGVAGVAAATASPPTASPPTASPPTE